MNKKVIGISAIVMSLMLILSAMSFAAGPNYATDFTYNLVFEETFQKGSTNKTSEELDENWLFGQGKADPFIDAEGRYQSGWVPGANIASVEVYDNYKLELDMLITKGAANGFGVRVPDSEDGALYGGGRAGVSGGTDLGSGIAFDIASEGNDGFYAISFSDRSKGMGESPFVKIALPTGFDFTTTNKYTVYDTGSVISLYVNDTLWASIELTGLTEGMYTKAKVYGADGTQVGSEMTISIVESGRITSYGRTGKTTIDNVKVYDMVAKNAQTSDVSIYFAASIFVAVMTMVILKKKVSA